MRAPEFWNGEGFWARLAIGALTPVGWAYGATVAWKAGHAAPYRAAIPVICIGNLTAGGSGKTPVAIAVAQQLLARGHKPFFLSRGYGGRSDGPQLVTTAHHADEVGDEPLLLAAVAPVIVSRDRAQGAKLAADRGADVIVMDDGHQNFTVAKDLAVVVVDAERPYGNGRILPSGPLREPVNQGLARADAVVMVGEGGPAPIGFPGPILRARLKPTNCAEMSGRRVLAFAGIGRPEKFFRSVRACGSELVGAKPFADHHVYTPLEIAGLKAAARKANAALVTTEKDYVRLNESDRDGIAPFRVNAVFDDPARLGDLLDRLTPPL